MIIDSLIYVIDKGYVDPGELSPGDSVYTLHGNKIEQSKVKTVQSDFISESINVVSSGQASSLGTSDTRYLFVNGYGEYRSLAWQEIPKLTRDKAYRASNFLPVLTALDDRPRTFTDSELDGLARLIATEVYDPFEVRKTLLSLTGLDNYIFIEFLENWCSYDPGKGYGFSKVLVKSRMFDFAYKQIADQICRVANMAGWTAETREYERRHFVAINFEATPSLGSIPKTQKYYTQPYVGIVYNVDAGNVPIMGRTAFGKYCFIPTMSKLFE